MALPDGLGTLFLDGGIGRTLNVPLPSGELANDEDWDRPGWWESHEPVSAELWTALRIAHPRSGLWPLILSEEIIPDAGEDDEAYRDPARIDAFDLDAHLTGEWRWHEEADRVAGQPFRTWPGLAPPAPRSKDPGLHADQIVRNLTGESHLALVPAARGADVLTVTGWTGSCNYGGDTAPLSALLRTWEDRFGATVVSIDIGDLWVAVAAPPQSMEDAMLLAAEHLSFCSSNISYAPNGFPDYARKLLTQDVWHFWWD
ncbi:DUF4253 domain-containing protein [Actinocorallia aurantiaca]|uniref:DUF4253 domain-containing protein n=1 Tax=Actinocorallia aurantiaca TaxID=46204 RepID=A0ABN3UBN7_9ACTN